MYGLPVHLWERSTFEKIGTICGGLIEVETHDPCSLEWASLLVRKPKKVPEFLWIQDGELAYKIQLCQPKLPIVFPAAEILPVSAGDRNEGGQGRGRHVEVERRERSGKRRDLGSSNFKSLEEIPDLQGGDQNPSKGRQGINISLE